MKPNHILRLIFPALTAAACFSGAVSHAALVVNADFSRDITAQNPGSNPAPVLYSGTAAAPDAGTVWNDLRVPLTAAGDDGADSVLHAVQFNDLATSTGLTTTIDIQLTSGFYRSFNGGTSIATNPTALQNDRVFARLGNAAVFKIQGLDSLSTYDLYFIGGGGFPTAFTVGSTTQNVTGAAYSTEWIEGQQYALISGVSPSIGGEITVSLQDGQSPIDGFAVITGLQIVQVPEPHAAILAGIGLLSMTLRRRRTGFLGF